MKCPECEQDDGLFTLRREMVIDFTVYDTPTGLETKSDEVVKFGKIHHIKCNICDHQGTPEEFGYDFVKEEELVVERANFVKELSEEIKGALAQELAVDEVSEVSGLFKDGNGYYVNVDFSTSGNLTMKGKMYIKGEGFIYLVENEKWPDAE